MFHLVGGLAIISLLWLIFLRYNKFNYFKDKVSKNFKGLENIQKGGTSIANQLLDTFLTDFLEGVPTHFPLKFVQ